MAAFGDTDALSEEAQAQARLDLIQVYLRMKEAVAGFETQAVQFKEMVHVQLEKNKAIEEENS